MKLLKTSNEAFNNSVYILVRADSPLVAQYGRSPSFRRLTREARLAYGDGEKEVLHRHYRCLQSLTEVI